MQSHALILVSAEVLLVVVIVLLTRLPYDAQSKTETHTCVIII